LIILLILFFQIFILKKIIRLGGLQKSPDLRSFASLACRAIFGLEPLLFFSMIDFFIGFFYY